MRVGVIGATGVVGSTILTVLAERNVPVTQLFAYASRDRDAGITFRDVSYPVARATVERIAADAPDVVFFASSDDASEEMAEALAARGIIIIDNSSTFRLDPRVPLVIPEVNSHAIRPEHRIFPVGNCTAIILCVALKPIVAIAGLRSVRVATYQAVSGAGRAGLEALAEEEAALASGKSGATAGSTFAAQIARNVIPLIGGFDGTGETGEEEKVAAETRKTLELPDLHVAATTVRVPVRTAHSEAVFVETERPTSVAALAEAFAHAPGIVYHATGIVTPIDVEGTDLVHVARLRAEGTSTTHFQLWIVGDQLRKGAATNGVQILETLISQGRFGAVHA